MLTGEPSQATEVVVIGAGPAGLTAAYELCKRGVLPTVLEQDFVVGGISRTVEADGWRFDIGGHRFFTKVGAVERVWHEMLNDDEFLTRPRMSRIFYRGRFFDYPLKPVNSLRGLGLREAVLCVLSYAWARVRPIGRKPGSGMGRTRAGYVRLPGPDMRRRVTGEPVTRRGGADCSAVARAVAGDRIAGDGHAPHRSGRPPAGIGVAADDLNAGAAGEVGDGVVGDGAGAYVR